MIHINYSKILKTGAASCLIGVMALAIASLSANDEGDRPDHNTATAPAKGDFIKGASLWAKTCQRCHNMRDPKELDDSEWKAVVTHMRLRAGLTGQDTRDILAFLQQSNDK